MSFFSVIIPTYNSSDTISKCLKSVLSQTFIDFEILVIDNLSTDNTVEIAKSFNDNRINVYSELDKGIYDAMNKGIKKSEGEWLYFLGSDDKLYDNKVLEDVNTKVVKSNLDVIYGNVIMMPKGIIYDGMFSYEKMQHSSICHQSIFYSRKIFKRFGIYNLNYKVMADHDFNIKWFFSRNINYLYFNRIIAIFNMDGFSSKFYDKVFFSQLPIKVFWQGISVFSTLKIKELAIELAISKKESKNKLGYLKYIMIYYFFRVINKIQRIFGF